MKNQRERKIWLRLLLIFFFMETCSTRFKNKTCNNIENNCVCKLTFFYAIIQFMQYFDLHLNNHVRFIILDYKNLHLLNTFMNFQFSLPPYLDGLSRRKEPLWRASLKVCDADRSHHQHGRHCTVRSSRCPVHRPSAQRQLRLRQHHSC